MEKIYILKKISGKIVQVDADSLTLETADGSARTFRLDPNVEITDEGYCSVQLYGLKNGQRAAVSYSVEDHGPLVAKMVTSFIYFQS